MGWGTMLGFRESVARAQRTFALPPNFLVIVFIVGATMSVKPCFSKMPGQERRRKYKNVKARILRS